MFLNGSPIKVAKKIAKKKGRFGEATLWCEYCTDMSSLTNHKNIGSDTSHRFAVICITDFGLTEYCASAAKIG